MQMPSIGRIVQYRSRTGAYTVPAIITATTDTLNPLGVKLYIESGGTKGVPPLNGISGNNVHLTVLTPGIPGMRGTAEDFEGPRADAAISENVAGCYQEVGRAARRLRGVPGGRGRRSDAGHVGMASHPRVAPPGARLPVTRLADLPAKPLGVMLPDRHLPDLLSPDPLTWEWPYACHRHGHVWEVGSDRCTQCRAPWAEFGEEVATAVTRSDGHVVLVAIPPGIAP